MNFTSRFCNTLTFEHKYRNALPINETHNYKRKSNRSERYTQILYKNHSQICFSLKSFFLIDLSIEGGLANTTPTGTELQGAKSPLFFKNLYFNTNKIINFIGPPKIWRIEKILLIKLMSNLDSPRYSGVRGFKEDLIFALLSWFKDV